MKIDKQNRDIFRGLALRALADRPNWYRTAPALEQGGHGGQPAIEFMTAMSPQRVLDLLEQLDELERQVADDPRVPSDEEIGDMALEHAADLLGRAEGSQTAHAMVEVLRLLGARRAARIPAETIAKAFGGARR